MSCLLGWGPARALGSGPAKAREKLLKTSRLMGTAWPLVSHWDGAPVRGESSCFISDRLCKPGGAVGSEFSCCLDKPVSKSTVREVLRAHVQMQVLTQSIWDGAWNLLFLTRPQVILMLAGLWATF